MNSQPDSLKTAAIGSAHAPALSRLAETAGIWLTRALTRRRLRELTPAALADVGLTEAQRRRECARWCWQGEDGDVP